MRKKLNWKSILHEIKQKINLTLWLSNIKNNTQNKPGIVSPPGEISRLIKEKEADLDKYDHHREELQKRLAQVERDLSIALTQEKQAHEEDTDRIMREKVRQLKHFVVCLLVRN